MFFWSLTRLSSAGEFSQLVTFFWQQFYIYSYLTDDVSASLTSLSVICVHPVVKFWGQALLLAPAQGSLENRNTALHPCSGEFPASPQGYLPSPLLAPLGSRFPRGLISPGSATIIYLQLVLFKYIKIILLHNLTQSYPRYLCLYGKTKQRNLTTKPSYQSLWLNPKSVLKTSKPLLKACVMGTWWTRGFKTSLRGIALKGCYLTPLFSLKLSNIYVYWFIWVRITRIKHQRCFLLT